MSNPTVALGAPTHPPFANVVELDVRDDLRSGREPFARIMSAIYSLREDDVFLLRAIFEPAPLYSVLAKRGFAHEALAHSIDDWSIWFWQPSAHDDRVTWLDVRGLEPPEPLVRTLAALDLLPRGHALLHVNSRVPQLLFPMLAERGFACEVDQSRHEGVFVRIWHADADAPSPTLPERF